jgi:hypothetical protein
METVFEAWAKALDEVARRIPIEVIILVRITRPISPDARQISKKSARLPLRRADMRQPIC